MEIIFFTEYHFRNIFRDIAEELHLKDKLVILVIPPPIYQGDQPGMFDRDDFKKLVKSVDYFSLMTYDYSSPQRPGNIDFSVVIFF